MSAPNPYKPTSEVEIAKKKRRGLLEFSRFETIVGYASLFVISAFLTVQVLRMIIAWISSLIAAK